MPSRKTNILETEEGQKIRDQLRAMESDEKYITKSTYSASSESPDGQISFVERHMLYLSKHKDVSPDHYISNLRLKIRVR